MRYRPLQRAMTTNATTSGFTAKTAAVTTRPSGNKVLELVTGAGGEMPRRMRVYPFGLGSANDVFSMRVFGIMRLHGSTPLYLHAQFCELSCTLGSYTGVAGTNLLATELPCDTLSIVATVGEATITADTTRQGSILLYSPANNMPAWFEIDLPPCELLEFDWDQTTNTPEMNALIQFID